MTTDLHDTSARTAYFLTFTCAVGDFPSGFQDCLVKFHVRKCEQAFLVREGGESTEKHLHYHSVGTFKAKSACNITRQCQTLYSSMEIPWGHRAVVVKKVTVLVGMFSYLLKEMGEGSPLLAMGWKMSWIKEQVVSNVSKIPFKVLMKNKHCLSSKTATSIVVEYAKAKSLAICDKLSFAEVICEMAEDGYQFEAVKLKWVYCQVMSVLGSRGPMRSMVLNELNFLD